MHHQPEACITFHLVGQVDGVYVVRATTSKMARRNGFDVQQAISAAQSWLLDNVPLYDHSAGNGNVRDYPSLPGTFANGNAFVICFRKLSDVRRFSQEFQMSGTGPELAT